MAATANGLDVIDIRNLILPETETEDKEEVKTEKPRKAPAVEYTAVLESGCDFAIRRKTAKTSRLLVILMSQGQFYIKDETNGDIQPCSLDNIRKFMADAPAEGVKIPEVGWLVSMRKEKEWLESFLKKINRPENQKLARKGRFMLTDRVYRYAYAEPQPESELEWWTLGRLAETTGRPLKELLYAYATTGPAESPERCLRYASDTIKCFETALGTDCARRLMDAYVTAGVNRIPTSGPYVEKVLCDRSSRRKFDMNSFIDYAVYDIQREGFLTGNSNVNLFWNLWGDSYSMEQALYGKVKTKYPANLDTHHRKLSYLCFLNQEKVEAAKWGAAYGRMKPYEYSAGSYMVIAPETPKDMHDEARQQCNCLASYIRPVVDGEKMIFFLRKKDAPGESLVTIEVFNGGRIGQVKAKNNRQPDYDCLAFVEKWAEEKGLDYTGMH